MAFFGEACVELVAVVITFLCVSICNYVNRRSAAMSKSLKKLSELEGGLITEEESVDSLTEVSKCGEEEKEEKETREFNEVAQRMAGRMLGLLEQLDEEEEETGEFNKVAERMAGRLASVWQTLVEVDDAHVAERMVALSERDGDVDASTECSAEAWLTDDDDISEEGMDSLEWDDVSFRMGRIFENVAEDEHDEQIEKAFLNESTIGRVGPRFSSASEVPTWEILESYGVLGAPIGAWRSSRCC
jgi:hypothetical protein